MADTNGRHGAVQWNRPGPVAQKRWGYLRRGTLVARSCPLGILEIDVDQLRPRQQRQRRGEVVPQWLAKGLRDGIAELVEAIACQVVV